VDAVASSEDGFKWEDPRHIGGDSTADAGEGTVLSHFLDSINQSIASSTRLISISSWKLGLNSSLLSVFIKIKLQCTVFEFT